MKRPERGNRGAKKSVKIPFHAFLLYLTVATMAFTGVVFASFVTSSTDGSGGVKGASCIIAADGSGDTKLTLDCSENTAATDGYELIVTNQEGIHVSEVSLEYDILVTLPRPLPDGVTMEIDGYHADVSAGGTLYRFSGGDPFVAGSSATHRHYLKFSGDPSSLKEDNTLNGITVEIDSRQID